MVDLRKLALLIAIYGLAHGGHIGDSAKVGAQPKPTDCKELLDRGHTKDGVYTIKVAGGPVNVYCEMGNGGWTVINRRYDGNLSYRQDMENYAQGFGDANADHWLGLNYVHELTSTGNWTLHVDMEDFDGNTAWAEYSDFYIDPGTLFTLYFDKTSYRGTAGDSFSSLHGENFATQDLGQGGGNCVQIYQGAFWYGNCGYVILTGMPYNGISIYWYHWKNSYEILRGATMKIKRDN